MRKVFFTACPGCQARVRAWTRLIGRYCYCPLCAHRMMVRAPDPSAIGLMPKLDPAAQSERQESESVG